jgi:hypothetical protein
VNPEKVIGYVRDAGCVGLGLGGITYMTITGEVNTQLLVAFMGLLGYTGGRRMWQLRPSNGGGRGRSSSSPPPGSRSPSSSSAEGEP